MTLKTRLFIRFSIFAGLGALALAKSAYGQGKDPAADAPAAQAPAADAPAADAAAAQAAPAPLVPPKLVSFVDAVYPEAAKAAGRGGAVELELTLDAQGQVTGARVVTPAGEGFDEAALAAAKGFRFEPARKGEEPIAARILYRYVFEPKPPEPPPPTQGALEGRVVLRGDDGVVRGAKVSIRSADGSVTREAATGPDGSFHFDGLPEGAYRVQVAGQDLQGIDLREEVTAGDLTAVTYRLDPVSTTATSALEFGATATIEAPPREVTKRSLKAEELLRAAGTRGDALRAIELMPGVAKAPMGMVIIRGSSPADSEVQFEGAPVFRLYHFGGLTSFVQSRMLDRIDLYPGNFSARYGRKLGGIVDVGVRDPKSDRFHGMVDVNVVDTSLLAEGPIGSRASIAVAAKRSYIDFFFDKLMPEDIGVTAAPVYWDYQVIGSYRPTDRDRIRAVVYGSFDDLKLVLKNPVDGDPSVRGKLQQETGFHRAQLQWRHRYSDAVEHDISVTGGRFGFSQAIGPDVYLQMPGFDAFARGEWRARLGEGAHLLAGFDLQALRFEGRYHGPNVEPLDGNPDLNGSLSDETLVTFDKTVGYVSPAAYLEMILEPTAGWQIVPGVRFDYYGAIDRWSLDPRLTSRFELLPGTTLKGGAGLFSQSPDMPEALPGIGNPNLRPPKAEHYGLGMEQQIGSRLQVTLEGFHKRLRDLVVTSSVPGQNLDNAGIGRIWGAEASARLNPTRRTTGFLSYTLSRSERNDDGRGNDWRLFSWDQTHILTLASSVRLGAGWDLSGTFRYISGSPLTPVVDSTYNANNDLYRPLYGEVNSARDPAFHRLDLRIEKVWQGKTGSIAAYLDVQNAYNRRSQEGRVYNYDFRQSKAIPGLPLIPSLGIRGEL